MFREFLVYHSNSLEFRAELITLMILSDDKILKCETDIIADISAEIYGKDNNRSKILYEAIQEYHLKIITNNNLGYNELINKISKDIKVNPRYAQKINIEQLDRFKVCMKNEDDKIFHDRVISFLKTLKDDYGKL